MSTCKHNSHYDSTKTIQSLYTQVCSVSNRSVQKASGKKMNPLVGSGVEFR